MEAGGRHHGAETCEQIERARLSWRYDLTLIHTPLQPPTALEADEVEHELSFNVTLRFP